MKKVFLFLIAITITIISCQTESSDLKYQENDTKLSSSSGNRFVNPYEYIGIEHNNLLSHLINIQSESYQDAINYLSISMNISNNEFLPYEAIQSDLEMILQEPTSYFLSLNLDNEVRQILNLVEQIIRSETNISSKLDLLAESTFKSTSLNTEYKKMLLGTIAVGKHSDIFWNEYETEASRISDKWKRRIADLSGFGAGFLGVLIYNNNNDNGTDFNPFTAGAAVGGLASKAWDD